MTVSVRNIEWTLHNRQRAYPLAADTTRKDLTGSFTLPDDFITFIRLPVHWGQSVQTGKFCLRRLTVSSNGYAVVIGYSSGGGYVDVAGALIPKIGHVPGNSYNLGGINDFDDVRGTIQIGELDNIELQPGGVFEFDLDGARLEPDAITPYIRSVMSLRVRNGSEVSRPLTGHLILQAGRNQRIRVEQQEGNNTLIIFDAIDGFGTIEDCVCDDTQANPVRTLSLVGPDGQGNINLLGANPCFQIIPGEHALYIKDVCSEPCCGCPELATVTQTLEAFGSQATTLQNFLVELNARVTQMDMVVLGSRLGDRGCVPAPNCPTATVTTSTTPAP
jgi:hypothetical protein